MRRVVLCLCSALLFALVGCSGGGDNTSDASAEGDAAPDVPCPVDLPVDTSTCPWAGQKCFYGDAGPADGGHDTTHRCDCVAPEMQWVCCGFTVDRCLLDTPDAYGDERMDPLIGKPCCVYDIQPIGPGVETTGCTYCRSDDIEREFLCASNDRHWRYQQTTCMYPTVTCPDGSPAPLDGGSCDGDDSGNDAATDATLDGGLVDGPSESSD